MFCGHIDTVGVEGMDRSVRAADRDGRLYGRGAQDMKGGVAAMIAAARCSRPPWSRGRLIVAAVVDEEHMSLGAEALVQGVAAPTWPIVTEPTDLRARDRAQGICLGRDRRRTAAPRTAAGRPRDAMRSSAWDACWWRSRRATRNLRARRPVPFQGTGSLHASLIQGGQELSSYPDRCTLQMERRTVSGEDGARVERELGALLVELQADDPRVRRRPRLIAAIGPAYQLDPAHPLPAAVGRAGDAGLTPEPTGMSFWTDAAILAGAGMPSVLFGPGGAGLHSTVEDVNVEDV